MFSYFIVFCQGGYLYEVDRLDLSFPNDELDQCCIIRLISSYYDLDMLDLSSFYVRVAIFYGKSHIFETSVLHLFSA